MHLVRDEMYRIFISQ